MNGAGTPPATPPAIIQKATPEQLEARIAVLEARGAEDYASLRELAAKIDKNHLVVMDCLGELARMLGKETAVRSAS